VNAFVEKPRSPEPMPGDPSSALASMGNYVFATEVLVDVLREDAARQSDHDFGRTIIPEQVRRHRLFAYNFRDHRVPGVRPHEEPAYWRDVGTIRSYYEAQMDQLGAAPRAARTPPASRCTGIPRASSSCRAASPPARCPRRSNPRRASPRPARPLLPAPARAPVARGGRAGALGGALPRLERAHHGRVLRAERGGARLRFRRSTPCGGEHLRMDELRLRPDAARLARSQGA